MELCLRYRQTLLSMSNIKDESAEKKPKPRYKYMSLGLVNRVVPHARKRGVSKVARGPGGFISQYRKAKGNPKSMTAEWIKKRDAFVDRHMAQVKKGNEKLWETMKSTGKTRPTKRHLALMMWAYTPDTAKVKKWLANASKEEKALMKHIATIPDFKGSLDGIAFHTFPKVNANHASFDLTTVENSLDTLVDTPINVHHVQWDIAGTIKDASIGEARPDGVRPVEFKGTIWKGVDVQSAFLQDVINSAQNQEDRYKISMEVQFDDWKYFAYTPGTTDAEMLDDEQLNSKHPDEVVGTVIPLGEHAGKVIGILLGGVDGRIVFNGVAITIEDMTPAADQEAVITAAGNEVDKVKVDEGEVKKLTEDLMQALSSSNVTTLKQTAESIQENTMNFNEMSLTELLSYEGEDKADAVKFVEDNFVKKPEESEATEAEKADSSLDLSSLTEKLDLIINKLTPEVSEEEASKEVKEEVDPKDELIADLSEELLEHRVDKLEEVLGDEYMAEEANKTKQVDKVRSMSAKAFADYVTELKAIAEAQEAKLKKAAEEQKKAETSKATAQPVSGISLNNFDFSLNSEEDN